MPISSRPLTEVWSLHELAIKAAPLILIAVGLSVCYLSNNWNIGAEGQFVIGAVTGAMLPILFPGLQQSMAALPLMLIMGMLGGAAFAAIPAFLKARFNTNEILTSLMLVYVAQLFLDWLVRGPWKDPAAMNFPQAPRFTGYAVLPEMFPMAGRANAGIIFAIVAAVLVWVLLNRMLKGFEVKVIGMSPRAGRFAGFSTTKMIFFSFLLSGALAGLAGISEVAGAIGRLQPSISPGYGFAAIIVAFLGRLNPLGIIAAGLLLALTYLGGEAAQISVGVSDKVVRAFRDCCCSSCSPATRSFTTASGLLARLATRLRPRAMFESILLTIATAATPLLIAAIGELVVERSGVLNLGVEGMMLMGAVTGFGAALATGNPWIGVLAAIIVGALFSLLFGFLALTLATNQVATGLALTLLGHWPVGHDWNRVCRPARHQVDADIYSGSDRSADGAVLFWAGPVVLHLNSAGGGVSWFLFRTRAGLTLRSIGDSHTAAHALGIKVIPIRYAAVAFGGACAGLAGAQMSLVYTSQWIENMTAGRGWIALALVVFASWRPWRVLLGAYLFGAITIAQLHVQALSINDIPVGFGSDVDHLRIRPLAAWRVEIGAGAVPFFVALSGDSGCACAYLAQSSHDADQYAREFGQTIRAGSLREGQTESPEGL
jgi:ABC-type uncharacterized transport system permease subunit